MRTTLTIDPDVEELLRQTLRNTGAGMKSVINDALRTGLGANSKPKRVKKYTVKPHAFGFKPGVDQERLNQLTDDLEVEELARRLGE